MVHGKQEARTLGVVTCVYDSKCIDYDICSKRCKGCTRWSKQSKNTAECVEWKSSHACPANHSGSSSSMESAGAMNILKRSKDKYNLQYANYLGDGDSSSFATVQEAKPYGPDVVINKLECIGHIQKRIDITFQLYPTFKPTLNIPKAIYDIILPIYKELTDKSLLQKCLHGKTQNANEALHGLIWQKCPKTLSCGRKILEIGVASAVCTMNDVPSAIKYVLGRMSLRPRAKAEKGLATSCKKRARQTAMRNSEQAKRRRKGWTDTLMALEGETYGAGKF